MKFDPKSRRLSLFLKKLFQHQSAKYLLLSVAFIALIAGTVQIYNALSKRYEEKPAPPSIQSSSDCSTSSETTTGAAAQVSPSETTSAVTPSKASVANGETHTGVSSVQTGSQVDAAGRSAAQPEKAQTPSAANPPKSPESPKLPDASKTENDRASETASVQSQPSTAVSSAATPSAPAVSAPAPSAPERPSSSPSSPTSSSETEPPKKNTAPNFSVLNTSGNAVRLSDKLGRPIILNFWATWCPPCRRELPDFDKLFKEYGDRVEFMMINLTDGRRDTVAGTKRFVAEKGYSFPLYFDTRFSASNAYTVSSIPQTTFIDKNGNVFKTRIGAMNEATLRSYINTLLGG